jgi:type I restriction enzyme S subunit
MRAGYKMTDLGAIPNDWDCVSVADLVRKGIIEKPMDGNHGEIHPKSSEYVDYGIPFVMANNVQNGIVDLAGCKFITKERADGLRNGFSVTGDVLLTHKATIGNTAIVGSLSTDYIMLTPQVTYYRVLDFQKLDSRYLRHYFDGTAFQSLIKSLSGGGTRAYIGIGAQVNLLVILPPLPEQQVIAAALSDVDALLNSLDALIAKKRLIKQGAMQELLTGKRRLQGFTDKWKTVRLDEIITRFSTGLNPRLNFTLNTGGTFYYVTIKNFKTGSLFLDDNCDKVDEHALSLINARSDLRKDDILFSSIGRIGDVFLIKEKPRDWNINESVFTLRPNQQKVIPLMLYHILTSEKLRSLLEKGATGSTFQSVKMADLRAAKCYIPTSKDEQFQIAEILSDMDAEIRALEQKREKTRLLKQGMMQELLTGRIRLI